MVHCTHDVGSDVSMELLVKAIGDLFYNKLSLDWTPVCGGGLMAVNTRVGIK